MPTNADIIKAYQKFMEGRPPDHAGQAARHVSKKLGLEPNVVAQAILAYETKLGSG